MPERYFWYAAPVYWVVLAFGVLDRFILMLHCTSHRTLFKKQYGWANQIIPWVIGPFMGETPETYFAHHMGMHHPENNLPEDLSSTMKYQRDSLARWLMYYTDFLFVGLARLIRYHARKGNPKLLMRTVVGEGSFLVVVLSLCAVNWRASMAVFLAPLVIVRLLMMAGNWGQHAFVDASDPGNAYKNSITCINSRYNRRAFNDGYHIHHHVKARTHWTELPAEFRDNIACRRSRRVTRGLLTSSGPPPRDCGLAPLDQCSRALTHPAAAPLRLDGGRALPPLHHLS